MKNLLFLMVKVALICGCATNSSEQLSTETDTVAIAKVQEENYDVEKDSVVFSSATIENFDRDGNSIDVFWLDESRDTVLKFYRTYDDDGNLIGARYYEAGDDEPSRDTVYVNSDGLKVEASLNGDRQITWKSTTQPDDRGNPVLKTYENGKGEYRGLDSLFFDDKDRVVKGFYKNSKGKRMSVKTYQYTQSDEYGNWIEREMYKDDTLRQRQVRVLSYY